eukprot:148106_1
MSMSCCGEDQLKDLCIQLADCSVPSVHLCNESVGHKHANKLARALRHNNSIEQFSLARHGNIRTAGVVSLCDALTRMPARLRLLRLDGTWARNLDNGHRCERAVSEVCARHIGSLECVDVSNNKGSCTMVAQALSSSNVLIQLNLACTRLGIDGITRLAALLSSPQCVLRSLNVSGVPEIAGQGLMLLCSAFKDNRSLERLSLAKCTIRDEGAFQISKGLRTTFVSENESSTFLKFIDLSENFIDDAGARTLYKVLTKMAHFKRVGTPHIAALFIDLKYNRPLEYHRDCFQRIWRRMYVGRSLSGHSAVYRNPSQTWRGIFRKALLRGRPADRRNICYESRGSIMSESSTRNRI